jgi:lactoylglutathione lyase
MTLPELPDAPLHPEFIGWAHIAINVGSKAKVTAWPSEPGQRHAAQRSAPDRRRLL